MKTRITLILVICLNLIFCASSQKKIKMAREKDPRYHYNMGLFFLNTGNFDEAMRYLKTSLSLNPGYDLALNALGLTWAMKGNFEESVKCYQECLKVNPSLTEAHNNLGSAYQELGLIDKAETEFRIALSDVRYKSRELPYYNLARLYLMRERFKEALGYVEKSLEIDKGMAMGYNLKGMILEKMNNLEGAIENYKKAVEKISEDPNFNFNLAVAYFKNNDPVNARVAFERTLTLKTISAETKEKIDAYLKMIK
jgi:tetratricopeptide (TPR) repeat protein